MQGWRRGGRFVPKATLELGGAAVDLAAMADTALASLDGAESVTSALSQELRSESLGWRVRLLRFRYGSDEAEHSRPP